VNFNGNQFPENSENFLSIKATVSFEEGSPSTELVYYRPRSH